ncbi:Site-specific DNA recombinase [Roseovarius pacificus]|uniref:Site-specific DNA recombinase n=1 Tax=Roseovarius pacificus TaxID=337701 RepID=A0A1M6YWC6_9RHOB|nr:recombinase family protein [Roseovarius pacificus]GGO50300.1 hypothetical protein GCM10011315_00740 [Roseovarius pacificus]SHL22405.1 Site-specific DNA recombinase [Roseovarius pacificus]
MKIVSYTRVSTARQGASGLGLAGQTTAIEAYAAANAAITVGAFTEVESGRNNDRPELAKAMKLARVTGAVLVIARLDRLSRSAAFLLSLQESGVDFVCCDNPHATPLTIGVLALVAQTEAEAISARIKAALAATKAKGTKLGNPNGAAALRRAGKGNTASVKAIKDRANARATDLADTLLDLTESGFTTLQQQANELNHRGIKTARGGRWHASSVANLRKRLNNVA